MRGGKSSAPQLFLGRIEKMSDYERYGDYDDIDEEEPRSKNPVMIMLRIMTAVICISVVGMIAFRLFTFNSYPSAMKEIYFNDKLTEYYNATNGDIGAKTQSLRAPYDHPDLGRFFCDHLVVIEGIDQLQITVRYNVATVAALADELGITAERDDPEVFSYRLVDNYGRVYDEIGGSLFDSRAMYRYVRLVFDGVELDPEGGNAPEWIRLEIFVGQDMSGEPYSMVPVYENNADYSAFSDYKLSGKEKP